MAVIKLPDQIEKGLMALRLEASAVIVDSLKEIIARGLSELARSRDLVIGQHETQRQLTRTAEARYARLRAICLEEAENIRTHVFQSEIDAIERRLRKAGEERPELQMRLSTAYNLQPDRQRLSFATCRKCQKTVAVFGLEGQDVGRILYGNGYRLPDKIDLEIEMECIDCYGFLFVREPDSKTSEELRKEFHKLMCGEVRY